MGRPPTTAEDKKIKKRARQQRYRAKKRGLLKQETTQLSPSDPLTVAPSPLAATFSQKAPPLIERNFSINCYLLNTNGPYRSNIELY